jgi:diadenosine tetraphosphate (Ap4A) HIT family hydrolase
MSDEVVSHMISSFEPPKHLVIIETEHWMLSHRVDSALSGYLMLGAQKPTNELSLMPPGALTEIGTLLAQAQKAINAILKPRRSGCGPEGFHARIQRVGWAKARSSRRAHPTD